MGSNWINLKCSSQYVLTSLPPITKQSPAEGLVQASLYTTLQVSQKHWNSNVGIRQL